MNEAIKGILFEAMANDIARWMIGKAIAVGIQRGVIRVDYVNGNFQVTLPKSWIEQQLGQRLPL